MKLIVDKNNKVITGCDDSTSIVVKNKETLVGTDKIFWGVDASNSDIIEGATNPPTALFSEMYSYDNGTWTELWDTTKAKAAIVKKCDNLLADVPSGTQSQWNEYVAKVTAIKDGLMETVSPFLVFYPKKP